MEDIDFARRLALVGEVRHVSADTSFTVSNREAEISRLMEDSATQMRKEIVEEEDCKMMTMNLPEFERPRYRELTIHNTKLMQTRLQKKQWWVNMGVGKQPGEKQFDTSSCLASQMHWMMRSGISLAASKSLRQA